MSTSNPFGAEAAAIEDATQQYEKSQAGSSAHPHNPGLKIESKANSIVPVGNPAFELMLKMEGKLGCFLPRDKCNKPPTHVTVHHQALRSGAYLTLKGALNLLLRLKGYTEPDDIERKSEPTAQTLADGVMIGFYLKLRNVAFPDPRINQRFLRVPQKPAHFTVPAPFAIAISELGIIKVSSLPHQLVLVPTYAVGTENFGLPTNHLWSCTAYDQAREYAMSLGMSFECPDLNVKLGSSWWLYREETVDDRFTLVCPLPEDNFSEETAILRTMFTVNETGGFSNELCDLSVLKPANYGSMFRNPPAEVNVSTFFAYDRANPDMWRMVGNLEV